MAFWIGNLASKKRTLLSACVQSAFIGAGQCNNPTKIYKISFRKVAKHRGGHTKIKIVRLESGQAPIQGTFNISVITVLKLGSQENLAPRDV